MIVVFVIDTSPSMGEQLIASTNNHKENESNSNNQDTNSGMSKLDLAKMTVESISKMMEKRIYEHNTKVQEQQQNHPNQSFGFHNGYCLPDQFLLLSTGRQQVTSQSQQKQSSSSAVCGAGGRLLVGFGEYNDTSPSSIGSNQQQQLTNHQQLLQQNHKHEAFEKELKLLNATSWVKSNEKRGTGEDQDSSSNIDNFPEDGGGSIGLNIALSTGLQLLSRYRLHNSATENFGMGRLPTNQNLIPNNISGTNVGGIQKSPPGSLVQASSALQPACLILLTDGECLRRPKSEGGGSLQLQFNMPLRELYRERKSQFSIFALFVSDYSF
jgi:hypothetical protein